MSFQRQFVKTQNLRLLQPKELRILLDCLNEPLKQLLKKGQLFLFDEVLQELHHVVQELPALVFEQVVSILKDLEVKTNQGELAFGVQLLGKGQLEIVH